MSRSRLRRSGSGAASTSGLVADLEAITGRAAVLTDQASLVAYESDALGHRRAAAAVVVLPADLGQVQQIVSACCARGVPFVARGHGTGLSGGATPVPGGVVIGLARLDGVHSIDPVNRTAVVGPGATTAAVTRAAAPHGLFFAPDPSSGEVCSIGGNIAENAGGAHCLKYGTTVNHVLGLRVVLADGTLITLGGSAPGLPGSELLPVFVGSEGTLGVVVEATLRLTPRPEAVVLMLAAFPSMVAAAEAVSGVIAAGIVPAAMEAMDRISIQAGEPIAHAGLPLVEAALLVELDGPEPEVAVHGRIVEEVCRSAGAEAVRLAKHESERALLWKARKAAVAGIGRISPAYLLQDGVVPRTRLPDVISQIADISDSSGLLIANVFHAGDGNLHPLICYDPSVPGDLSRAEAAAAKITEICLSLGGSVSGEHGIGLDKRDSLMKMLSVAELETHGSIRSALDPAGLANPGKLVEPSPSLKRHEELDVSSAASRHAG